MGLVLTLNQVDMVDTVEPIIDAPEATKVADLQLSGQAANISTISRGSIMALLNRPHIQNTADLSKMIEDLRQQDREDLIAAIEEAQLDEDEMLTLLYMLSQADSGTFVSLREIADHIRQTFQKAYGGEKEAARNILSALQKVNGALKAQKKKMILRRDTRLTEHKDQEKVLLLEEVRITD